jgi:dolichol-phosphate mannosyltransferase
MSGRRFDYSIVIPVYCNEGSLAPLFRSLSAEVLRANPERTGEIIFVDDGSEDDSFAELQRIRGESPSNVTIIKLTRNFGQGNALIAGYEHARGDCVVTISADGQEPSSLINEMLQAFFAERYEIVIATRTGRDESLYRKITSRLYFSTMRALTFKSMPRGGFDVWLMGRRALTAFLRQSDMNPSFQWRVLWMGFQPKFVTYHRRARMTGVSRYTFAKKLTAVLDGVLSYSVAPIRAIWIFGCAFSLIGLGYAVYLLADRLLRANPVAPWAPVTAVILVVGGLQMAVVGIVGEYVWRTLRQARAGDLYLIDTIDAPEES